MSYFSEIETVSLEPNDCTPFDIKILSLWFYGDADDATTGVEQMYVALKDNDGNRAEVRYSDGEGKDTNDITIEEWQQWEIFTSSFTDVNFADLRAFFIGFGERYYLFPSGWGHVYFDDIRVYQLP